jgi:predicted phosphodiesterase
MTISGFTMVRNGAKLYYPIKQAIASILPICDEFVVALGNCDPDDDTLREIESIGSDKIRIIHTVWDLEKFPRGMEHAHQTDIAKEACTGDWLFYVQSDEVVHEEDLPRIRQRCEELIDDISVEGILFKYRHFWGDYDHYITSHAWYANEIRIIRNDKEIHSWESAQSFRRIPDFDGVSYREKKGTYKLKVARVDAYIYHYGWVRPPQFMQKKRRVFEGIHKGEARAEEMMKSEASEFNFGNLSHLSVYRHTHPAVMEEKIRLFNWGDQLRKSTEAQSSVALHKHERLKYRVLTFIEQTFLGGRQIMSFKNYRLARR